MKVQREKIDMKFKATYHEGEQYIWCVSGVDAYLYRLNKVNAIMEQVVLLSDDIYMQYAYGGILCYNNSFILVPQNANAIVLVNRNDWTKQYINLPIAESYVGTSMFKFFTGIVYQDYLFLFGYAYPGIVKVDLISKEVVVIDSWLKEQRKFFNDENDGCFHEQYCMLNDKVYFPFMNSNAVLQFDLKTEEVVIHKVGDDKQRYMSIEWDGICFWLVPRDGSLGSIVKWNPVSGAVNYLNNFPAEFDYHKFAFYRTEVIDNKLLLFAHRSSCNISIDVNTGKMETFPDLYCTENVRGCKYPLVWRENNKITVFQNMEWITWDVSNDAIEHFPYELEEKVIQRHKAMEIRRHFEKNGQENIYKEDAAYCNLETYLQHIMISGEENVSV